MVHFVARVSAPALCLLVASLSSAQAPDHGGKAQAAGLKKLEFMVGDWEGTGFIEAGGRRIDFIGTEKVAYKAGGTAVAVEGLHKAKFGDREMVIHDAYAVITFAEKEGLFSMRAQLANGQRNDFALEVKGSSCVWNLKGSPMGDVRYTMTLTPAGEWLEIGEATQADGSLKKIFEMRLRKKA